MRRAAIASLFLLPLMGAPMEAQDKITKYVRYLEAGKISYGILEGENIRELNGSIFDAAKPTGNTAKLSEVKLMAPCEPGKVIAVGLNYLSHLGERPPATEIVLFAKYPTSIVATGEDIVFPAGATNVHYEGEMVVVIGKEAKNVSKAEAAGYVFGVTAGNDVTEREWQRKEPQWLRAKASDTFGPIGPAIVQGLNYNDLMLTTRLNGEIRQQQRTRDMIHDVAAIVSHISRFTTLKPGDVIFMGTPGETRAMKPGDVVEVEIEGVGILRNSVAGP